MSQGEHQAPKVVVIGAGSLFFGRQAIWQMVQSPHLNGGTLALVDTDPERLGKMARLAEMVIAHRGVRLALEASTERTDVMREADFVVLSFAERSATFRGIDCQVSVRHGVRMCSGDTIGPGGIFRAMRELPEILACARDVASFCPDAWVINYVNPTAVMGIGLRRYAPHVKSLALCDGLHMPQVKHQYAVRAGIVGRVEEYTAEVDANFDLRMAGVNHFTWVLKAEYDGTDVVPAIADAMRQDASVETAGTGVGSKQAFNNAIGYQLYEVFGYLPACIGHTKEYLRFWQGRGHASEKIPPLPIWDPEPRYMVHDGMWEQVDDLLAGKIPVAEFTELFGPDAATATYAQYVVKQDWLLIPIPDGMSTEHASMACCGLGPTFNAMKLMNVGAFDTVLITGMGPVGLGGVINARFRGARVIAVESQPYRAELAKELGAEAVINPDDEDAVQQVMDLTGGLGVDKSVDTSGSAAAKPFLINAARRKGHVSFVGWGGEVDCGTIIAKGLTLHGVWHYNMADIPAMMQMIAAVGDQLDKLITHTFPMTDIQKAWDLQCTGNCGKVLLYPWK